MAQLHEGRRQSPPSEEPARERLSGTEVRSDIRELKPAYASIAEVSLFEQLEAEALRILAAAAVPKRAVAGATLMTRGEPASSVLLLVSGAVDVLLDSPAAGQQPLRLAEVQAPDVLGEMGWLDGRPRSATVVALLDCEYLELDRDVLQHLSPEVRSQLAVKIAGRTREAGDRALEVWAELQQAACQSAQAAVSVELQTVRTLYERTESRANASLAEGKRVAEQAEKQIASLRTWQASLLAGVIAVAGALGYRELSAVHDVLSQVEKVKKEVEDTQKEIEQKSTRAKTQAEEVDTLYRRVHDHSRQLDATMPLIATHAGMSNLRSVRALLQVPTQESEAQPSSAPDEIAMAALYGARLQAAIMSKYIRGDADAEGEDELQRRPVLVVLEALEDTVELERLSDGHASSDMRLSARRRKTTELWQALLYVLERLQASSSKAHHVLGQEMAQDLLLVRLLRLGHDLGSLPAELRPGFVRLVRSRSSEDFGADAAAHLLAAQRGTPLPSEARARLQAVVRRGIDQGGGRWPTARAAYALAANGDAVGWDELRTRLDQEPRRADGKDSGAYAMAVVLLERYDELLENRHHANALSAMTKRLLVSLCSHRPRNRLEREYVLRLAQRLSPGGDVVREQCQLLLPSEA